MEELGDDEYWTRKDFEDSKFYQSEGKLRWIWRKGVYLGRKMVLTGVVISSAPFVLPPLVALSAIGFALSLPAGFMLATYACTDKLMNILLPMPSPPLYAKSRMISDDEEAYMVYRGAIEKGYCEVPAHEDNEPADTLMRRTEIVEEDVGVEQNLDSNVIPTIMEGIQEADNEISLMERKGVEMPKDSLCAFVIEAEVGGENEDTVEQVTKELAFVSPKEEKWNKRNLAGIDEDKLRNETAGKLERIRDEVRDDNREQDSPLKGRYVENEENGGLPIKNVSQKTDDKNLFVIPEEVKPAGIGETEDLDVTVGRGKGKEIETEVMAEPPELVIERKVVVNVKTKFDDETGASDQLELQDSLTKRPEGKDLASDSGRDVSIDYLKVRTESASISEQEEIRLGQEMTPGSNKVLANKEEIWKQIHALRTIIGHKTTPHVSYVEEIKALYEFTGVEQPVLCKDAIDLADVNEKLYFLKSIVGVK